MDICIPPGTDWSCGFTDEELIIARSTPGTAGQIEAAEAFAWSLLAALTLYQIGTCPVTVRPCAARCAPSGSYTTGSLSGAPVGVIGRMTPYISGGVWLNACGCLSSCSCTSLSEVILPGPVGSIESIYIDGELVPRVAYRVDNGNRLVRVDGSDWPACQDMALDDHDGFSVTYYRGAKPNVMTRAAAGKLAWEFLEACRGNACRLPGNVISASRAGESYQFAPQDFGEGDTGIPEVNAVIRIYNPNGLKSAPRVISPDEAPVRVTTWR